MTTITTKWRTFIGIRWRW